MTPEEAEDRVSRMTREQIQTLIADSNCVIRNRMWQQGEEVYQDFLLKLRTCRWCGHVAEQESSECPVCGKLRIGGPRARSDGAT